MQTQEVSSSQTAIEEAQYVEEVLKDLGEPVRLKDLIELTGDKIEWLNNPTNQMTKYSRYANIGKAGYGLYEYTNKKNNELKLVKKERKDEDILDLKEDDKKLLDDFRSQAMPVKMFSKPKIKNKVGDIMKGKVTGIEEYGAFITNEDDTLQGLIHITNISNGVTDNVHRHFKLGDIVEAKIISVKNDGKLSLSTRGFDLPDYFRDDEMKEKLEPISNQLFEDNKTDKENKESYLEEIPREDDEVRKVIKFIQSITGVVSDEAKTRIEKMMEEEGMFDFMMALTKASKDFNVDVSMVFANEVEKHLRDGL